MANILIIEDDEMLQRSYSRMLRNHHVVIVASGEDAIEAISNNPLFDAIVSDYDIDGFLNGGDVFYWVKNHHPALVKKYIFVSANVDCAAMCVEHKLTFFEKGYVSTTDMRTAIDGKAAA